MTELYIISKDTRKLGQFIKECQMLSVILTNNKITSFGINEFLEGIKGSPLQSVDLSNTEIIIALALDVAKNSQIHTVNLSDNKLTNNVN